MSGVSAIDLVQKRCAYCLFEQILPPEYRKREILSKPLPPNHPRRLIIEEMCNGDGEDCDMKNIAMRAPIGEREEYQWKVLEICKLDLSKANKREVSLEETLRYWVSHGGGEANDVYAARFGKIWEFAKEKLTPQGAYEVIVSSKENFKRAIALAKRLAKERNKRVNDGLSF